MNMRDYIRIVEGIYDDDFVDEHTPGSFGWWIYPSGQIEELEQMGDHGMLAHDWLSSNTPEKQDDDYDEAIETLLQNGGIRVATFHGSDSMHIRFDKQHATVAARSSLSKLMRETRSDFTEYFIGDDATTGLDYRNAISVCKRIS